MKFLLRQHVQLTVKQGLLVVRLYLSSSYYFYLSSQRYKWPEFPLDLESDNEHIIFLFSTFSIS